MLNTNKINKTIKIKAGYSIIEMDLHDDIYTEIVHSNREQLIKEILDEVKKDLEDKFHEMVCFHSNQNNYNKVFNIQVGIFISEEAHKQ